MSLTAVANVVGIASGIVGMGTGLSGLFAPDYTSKFFLFHHFIKFIMFNY